MYNSQSFLQDFSPRIVHVDITSLSSVKQLTYLGYKDKGIRQIFYLYSLEMVGDLVP